MANSSPFTEGQPPDGRTLPPRKDVNPESEMTTRGYEHQRGLQAQEGHNEGREADELDSHSRDRGRPLPDPLAQGAKREEPPSR